MPDLPADLLQASERHRGRAPAAPAALPDDLVAASARHRAAARDATPVDVAPHMERFEGTYQPPAGLPGAGRERRVAYDHDADEEKPVTYRWPGGEIEEEVTPEQDVMLR